MDKELYDVPPQSTCIFYYDGHQVKICQQKNETVNFYQHENTPIAFGYGSILALNKDK